MRSWDVFALFAKAHALNVIWERCTPPVPLRQFWWMGLFGH
jgi:hypothetical protein